MELIIDGGATKCSWMSLDGSLRFETAGINASTMPLEAISDILTDEVLPKLQPLLSSSLSAKGPAEEVLGSPNSAQGTIGEALGSIKRVYFFGAGCTPQASGRLRPLLAECFPEADITIGSDIEGAALAALGSSPGVVCLMGTGSAAALWDGSDIIRITPSLGFILGDEGSGADLGKRLLRAYFKGTPITSSSPASESRRERRPLQNSPYTPLSDEARRAVMEAFPALTPAEAIRRTYRSEAPARWLAELGGFVARNVDMSADFARIVREALLGFLRLNVLPLQPSSDVTIAMVGSLASQLRPSVEEVFARYGYTNFRFVPRPIEALREALRKERQKQ